MKPFGAHRSGKHLMCYVMCTAVLIGFVWAGHAQALPQFSQRSVQLTYGVGATYIF